MLKLLSLISAAVIGFGQADTYSGPPAQPTRDLPLTSLLVGRSACAAPGALSVSREGHVWIHNIPLDGNVSIASGCFFGLITRRAAGIWEVDLRRRVKLFTHSVADSEYARLGFTKASKVLQ